MKINLHHFPIILMDRLKKVCFLTIVMCNLTFHLEASGQADVLSNLTPEELAQFNQLPSQQRQAVLDQLQLGSTAGFELPVTQPQTVMQRDLNEGRADAENTIQNAIAERDALLNLEDQVDSSRQRILKKAQELREFGLDLTLIDTFGELDQMGIITEIRDAEIIRDRARARARDGDGDGDTNTTFGSGDSEETQDLSESRLEGVPNSSSEMLKQFGYELFAGSPSTFAPATDIPVPSNYILGPGDTVVLQLYGQLNVRYELAVSREGLIQFPEVGPLNVSGLSFEEMRTLIETTVDNTLIGQEVSITMGALRSIQIFVLGEAYRPGVFTISSLSTITNALFSSGGVSNLGSLRDVRLVRGGEVVVQLDLYDLLLNGDTSNDARLQPNDVLFIPTIGPTVGVSGEVLRPGIYELNAEETVQDVLAFAGGVLPTAYPSLAHMERINSFGQRTISDIDLTYLEDLSTTVIDGDLIRVDTILDQVEFGLSLEGHIFRPGTYSWEEGKRVSDVIGFDDIMPNADFEYSIVVREIQPSRRIELYQFNLANALDTAGSNDDLVLQPKDRLLIFGDNSLENRLDRRLLLHPIIQTLIYQSSQNNTRKIVSIYGEIANPGEYPLTENMTIEQLLFAAGGGLESANLSESEITRTILSRERGMSIESDLINLQDPLVFSSLLESRDLITVREISNWGELERVFIAGEVESPGMYIIEKNESLSNLLSRAGGLTEYADPDSTIFTREELRRNEQALLDTFNDRLSTQLLNQSLTRSSGMEQVGVDINVMNRLLEQINSAEPSGRLVIDMLAILSNTSQAVVLRNGDEVFIPRSRQEISVIGEVQRPTSHLYTEGESIDDYIGSSGGYTRNADEENIFVIKTNGDVVPYSQTRVSFLSFSTDQFTLEAGDSIVVPYYARLDNPLVTWTNVSTVLFNLATTLLAIENVMQD